MPEYSGASTLPRVSASPIASDAINAPLIEPIPPITTTTKQIIKDLITHAGKHRRYRRGDHAGEGRERCAEREHASK